MPSLPDEIKHVKDSVIYDNGEKGAEEPQAPSGPLEPPSPPVDG